MNKMISGRAAGGQMFAGLVAAVLAFASFDVSAATKVGETVVRSTTLRYDAASLTNPVAAKKLYSRIRIAAQKVCHQSGDEASNGRALAACVLQATGVAVADVNSLELTALHRAGSFAKTASRSARLTSPTPCAVRLSPTADRRGLAVCIRVRSTADQQSKPVGNRRGFLYYWRGISIFTPLASGKPGRVVRDRGPRIDSTRRPKLRSGSNLIHP